MAMRRALFGGAVAMMAILPLGWPARAEEPPTNASMVSSVRSGERMDLSAFDQWADKSVPHRLLHGNHADVIIGGPAYLAAVSRQIAEARHSIVMTTFTFDDAASTNQVVDQLIAKAQQGVTVAVVIDWFGAIRQVSPQNLIRLQRSGVHVGILRRQVLHLRLFEVTHTKLCLCDGQVAFVGGQNFSGGGFSRHDLSLRVTGPILADIQEHFAKIWSHTGQSPVALAAVNSQPTGSLSLRSLQTTPDDQDFRTVALHAIDSAKREINIEQAYMTEPETIDRLKQAVARGVKVRMIIPTHADENIVNTMLRASLDDWLSAGIEVYRYAPSMHTKAISIDGVWATVGSTNTNHRGFYDNFELSLAISDPTLVQQLDHDLFATDLAIAKRVSPPMAQRLQGDWRKRLRDGLMSFARHVI